jgi:hypothetical protein
MLRGAQTKPRLVNLYLYTTRKQPTEPVAESLIKVRSNKDGSSNRQAQFLHRRPKITFEITCKG